MQQSQPLLKSLSSSHAAAFRRMSSAQTNDGIEGVCWIARGKTFATPIGPCAAGSMELEKKELNMRSQIIAICTAGAIFLGAAEFASAREGDKSVTQAEMADLPKPVQDTAQRSFVGSEAGDVFVIEREDGQEYLATFTRDEQPFILRIDSEGKVIEEARPQTESDKEFLASAEDSQQDPEAQLAAAMERADQRTPVSQEQLPEPVRTAAADQLEGATSIGRYKLPDGNFLLHYRSAEGKMMEMTLSPDGEVVQKPRERDILKATMPVKEEELPEAVREAIQKSIDDAKVENPQRVRYYRVGEDDYAAQFINDQGRQMSLRVDKDGSIVNELRETKKQPKQPPQKEQPAE